MSKYTTKQLLNMSQDEIDKICGIKCDTNKCPFKKSLRKYRFDGYCLKQTKELAESWIPQAYQDIEYYKQCINDAKSDIKFYNKAKKVFDKELEK